MHTQTHTRHRTHRKETHRHTHPHAATRIAAVARSRHKSDRPAMQPTTNHTSTAIRNSTNTHTHTHQTASAASAERTLHCLADLRGNNDATRDQLLRPYFMTAALRISSSVFFQAPPRKTSLIFLALLRVLFLSFLCPIKILDRRGR